MSIFTDNFSNYANGVLDSVDSANWVTDQGNSGFWQIAGGLLTLSDTGSQAFVRYIGGSNWTSNQYSAITVANTVSSTASQGPATNLSNGTGFGYALDIRQTGKWQFVILQGGGSASFLGAVQTGMTWGPTDTYQLTNTNGVLQFTFNGVVQSFTVTDTTYSGGVPGMYQFKGTAGGGDIVTWTGGTSDLAVVAWW